jgi:uncharacterized membrane protein
LNGDQRLEDAIGRVLRFGGMTSSVCLAVGLGLALTHGAAALSSVLLTTGLVILMATPAARVVVSLGEYAIEHDWPFVMLTAIVLLELLGSVVAAFR